MARRYRLEDHEDDKMQEEERDEELNEEEEEHLAQDEEEDARAEDGEPDEEANDEDDTDKQADDEDETKSGKARSTRLSERVRCAGLMRLEKTAKRLGVKFDAARAIANGLSLGLARSRILTAAAEVDRSKSISPYAQRAVRNFGNESKAKAAAMWRKAKKGKR